MQQHEDQMKLHRSKLQPTTWKAPLCTHCGRPMPRRPKATPRLRAEVARKFFRDHKRQIELALEYDVSQSTIAKWVAAAPAILIPERNDP